jgi:hypothetical protein
MSKREKHDMNTERGQRVAKAMHAILDTTNGMEDRDIFDSMMSAFEYVLNNIDEKAAKEAVLHSLNRFVIIQLMGREEYDKALEEIAQQESGDVMLTHFPLANHQTPTKH